MHDKVYGFCDAKCKVEVVPKEEFEKLDVTATYVVRDNNSLLTWANNTEGYNFSHVLIMDGDYTEVATIELKNTKTKIISGNYGNNLVNTTINGENSELIKITGVNAFKFEYCNNLTNCNTMLKLDSKFYSCDNLDNCTGAFQYCNYLSKCNGLISTVYFYYNGKPRIMEIWASPFYGCTYLDRCRSIESASVSENIVQPEIERAGVIENMGMHNFTILYAGFFDCKYVNTCTATANTHMKYAFNKCTFVHYCFAGVGYNTNGGYELFDRVYYYSSATDTAPYSDTGCDCSAEGGWNNHGNYLK